MIHLTSLAPITFEDPLRGTEVEEVVAERDLRGGTGVI